LKILIISNLRPNKSGITEQVYNIRRGLIEESHDISLISTYGTIFKRLKGIAQAFKEAFKSDLVIGTGCAFYGFLPVAVASIAAYFADKPVFYNFHDGQAEVFLKKSERLVKFFIRNKKVVVASEFVNEVFKKFKFNSELIPNIFDFNSFPKRESEFAWNKKIIWARSFENIYQPELALKIALKTLEKSDCEFHFYGDGSLYENLKKKYRHTGIIFHGLVVREQILKDLSESSVFLNTTLYDNMPNSFFESGFYKLLVLSTRVGGVATTFDDSEVVFAKDNGIESFAEVLSDILENPSKYNSYRENLYNKVLRYRWDKVKDKWLSLIDESVKKNK